MLRYEGGDGALHGYAREGTQHGELGGSARCHEIEREAWGGAAVVAQLRVVKHGHCPCARATTAHSDEEGCGCDRCMPR